MQQKNPYEIETPALISFSGGRTSAYMLYKINEAYNYNMPNDIFVTFANTGKEAEETLEFVDKCAREWNINIHWLEHYYGTERPIHRTKEVCFKTAARNGEPFERLLDARKILPNPASRFCSSELKIKVMYRFMRQQGYKTWVNVLGLRYDEPRRAISARNANYQVWENIVPLYDAQVTNEDVLEFWQKHNFDLQLNSIGGKTIAGNCDLCFLKSTQSITALLREKPDLADWWIDQESKFGNQSGAKFRRDRDYIQLVELSKQGDMLIANDISTETCFCHD